MFSTKTYPKERINGVRKRDIKLQNSKKRSCFSLENQYQKKLSARSFQ